MFKEGDYVVYMKGDQCEIGRVLSKSPDGKSYKVCYHEGCTAASTSVADLRPLINQYVIISTSLGHHRFDEICSEYSPDYCYDCKARNNE